MTFFDKFDQTYLMDARALIAKYLNIQVSLDEPMVDIMYLAGLAKNEKTIQDQKPR